MEWIEGLAWPMGLDTSTWWMALISALLVGVLLGAVPIGAAEAVALAAAAIPSVPMRAVVIATFTAGHVLGKAVWYWLGRLESRVTRPRLRAWIDRARTLAARHPNFGLGVTATSALLSVPPFHLTAIAAGLVRSPAVLFFAVSFLGRFVRFGALAAFPSIVRQLFG